MYADYEYYKNSYGGIMLDESSFNALAQKAERYLNYVTNDEISLITESWCGDKIKNAICSACEAVYEVRQEFENIPQGIKSENTDGYSVTFKDYDVAKVKEQKKQAMYEAFKQELSGTGLLYRGGI